MLSPNADTSIDGGRNVFMFLLGILLITCIGFVPLYSGIRLSLERNDANIDLFFVTTITPGAIVRGKYLTAMALTLLIFSACMPFMILTYLLRGIDLPTIFFILAVRIRGLRRRQCAGHLCRLRFGKLVHARTGGRGSAVLPVLHDHSDHRDGRAAR